jgi:hypothetical protein
MATSVFRGELTHEQCLIPFVEPKSGKSGTAVIDTGFPGVLVALRFVTRCDIPLDDGHSMHVHGVGQDFKSVPTANISLRFAASEGPEFAWEGLAACDGLPHRADLLLGTEILALGRFTLDGPARAWEWRIDHDQVQPLDDTNTRQSVPERNWLTKIRMLFRRSATVDRHTRPALR